MTRLTETQKRVLTARRDRLVMENKKHLNRGEWDAYLRNCQRISRITGELHRRQSEERSPEWRRYV